jgi:hypothetical protein
MESNELNLDNKSEQTPYSINLDTSVNELGALDQVRKKSNVRLIYCGDGVIEECDDDLAEEKRREIEQKQKQIELRRQQDLKSVNKNKSKNQQKTKFNLKLIFFKKTMNWLPWFGYIAYRSAFTGLESIYFNIQFNLN